MTSRDAPQALPALQFPKLDDAIRIATGQQSPIRTQGQRKDPVVLPAPDLDAESRGEITEPDRSIITAGCQQPPCRMKSHRSNPYAVAFQDAQQLSTADVPHLHQPII